MKDKRTTASIKAKNLIILRRYKRKLRVKSIDDVIEKLVAGYENSLTKINVKKPMLTQHGDLAESVPCLSRFDFKEMYYCGKNAPKIVALPTLKICSVCRFRITKEGLAELKERDEVKTSFYLQCGATERYDEKAGTFVFSNRCPDKMLRGKWHSINACKRSNCPMIKSIVVKKR